MHGIASRPAQPASLGALRHLYPGYFAFVMATGIVSTAASLFMLQTFSDLLLLAATIGYVLLVAMYLARLVLCPVEMREDLGAPGRAFGFFTFVAASNVLAARYVAAGELRIALILGAIGGLSWLYLTYTIPVGLMLDSQERRLGPSVNASWLIWVVATQSVSTAASVFSAQGPFDGALLAFIAAMFWGIGAVLYLILMATITARLLLAPMTGSELTPPYWINMGATAITVLAGARLLALPLPGELRAIEPVIVGVSFMFWAFGSFWIPALVLFGVWRYSQGRSPLVYEPALWSLVFPLGMYTTATEFFGRIAGLPWLPPLARGFSWIAYAAWIIVFLGLVAEILGRHPLEA